MTNTMYIFPPVALLTYAFSLGLIIPGVLRKNSAYRKLALLLALMALICHAIALKQQIFDMGDGQNFSLLNISAIVSLIMCSIMTFVAFQGRGWFLLPIVYSFAIINLIFISVLPGEFIIHLQASPALLIHISLALFSYATLMIAALYALQLAWLDYLLKHKKLVFTADMPPLMSLEHKTFHITQIGVVLLTLTLCTGLPWMDNLFNKENVHKAILSIMAWFVYMILLCGRVRGWRGRLVVWFSFSGVFLLTLAYFGSRLFHKLMAV